MSTKKNAAALAQPVAPSRWAQIREAERVGYGTAQPVRMSWQTGGTYLCPELRHRSSTNQPPSIVLGKRVDR
ncbi:hypothetical protein CLU86_0650 [Acidovorax sp. 62]|uniref:hypothetical protein n=1 Tax=Acidovorax sp. 62 TaxID=2035203 RepID=UPI000C1942A6|nr:hypothetical protein [Acidovorax sp. 62]PIF89773.1 hypothetical protein CLU86_0650 [Acidovorax sp. 62]